MIESCNIQRNLNSIVKKGSQDFRQEGFGGNRKLTIQGPSIIINLQSTSKKLTHSQLPCRIINKFVTGAIYIVHLLKLNIRYFMDFSLSIVKPEYVQSVNKLAFCKYKLHLFYFVIKSKGRQVIT